MSMATIGAGIVIGGGLLAGIVAYQDIDVPWAPNELVQTVSDNSASIAWQHKRWLTRELLNNRIAQRGFTNIGKTVPDIYLQQEQGFLEDIEIRDRQLRELEGK